jgi:hypothetical protein
MISHRRDTIAKPAVVLARPPRQVQIPTVLHTHLIPHKRASNRRHRLELKAHRRSQRNQEIQRGSIVMLRVLVVCSKSIPIFTTHLVERIFGSASFANTKIYLENDPAL